MYLENLKNVDKDIYDLIHKELDRQEYGLELIASENFVSPAVMEAAGTVLTNKYAEGYPYKRDKDGTINWEKYGRYYGGCEYVDEIEALAINRAKELFGAEHANVQAHSGTSANVATYMSFIKPGDTMMGMDLTCGGHLSHGHPLNFTGKFYNIVAYGVRKDTEMIDYEEVMKLAEEHRPKLIVAGASAYPRVIDFKKFREIADKVSAILVVDMAHIAGLVATGLHPSPVPYADVVTTTTHKTLRGPRSGLILCKEKWGAEIDKNVFPGNQGGPLEHIIAAKAVAFKEALTDGFKDYQKQVVLNAKTLADELKNLGHTIVSGGTDNHLMLVNLGPKGTGPSGKKIEGLMDHCNITINKNTVPYDTRKPFTTSGIRLGTPAMTTRGMKEAEMKKIAGFLSQVINNYKDETILPKIKEEVVELCKKFPLYKK